MKTLLILLFAAGFIYFLLSSSRKSKPLNDKLWEDNRNEKVRANTMQAQLSDKKFPNPKDVVERLSNSAPNDDTFNDEEKFEEMIDRYAVNGQSTKLENLLQKASENFSDYIKDRVQDSFLSGIEMLVEFYQEDN